MFYCPNCGFKIYMPRLRCPRCNSILYAEHGFSWSIDNTMKGIWRFRSLLPSFKVYNTLGEAFTPLIESKNISKELGLKNLYFKDEGRNPTGSFRDRAAALITSHAYSNGFKELVCATDGNMGASLAAYAARLGLRVKAIVPRNADYGKIIMMKALGAEVIEHGETLDDVYGYVDTMCREKELYNATSESNPLGIEGLKTIAYELLLDLGKLPDTIIIPIGSGLTLYSIYYGLREMIEHGITQSYPKLIGVQPCNNTYLAEKLGIKPRKCRGRKTVIIGLAYEFPPLAKEVIEAIKATKGTLVLVDNLDIIEAAKKLALYEGIFVEAAAATTVSALQQLVGEYLEKDETVAALLTGHGLKSFNQYIIPSRRRRVSKVFFPSDTKYEIIRLLAKKPGIKGYTIWKELGLQISVQAIYQHLNSLEKKGIIRPEYRMGSKVY
ncbi:MAG: pyridoxal-phosphate dependent enzyme, partial [Desulfurococcales archaeon]|nr:pyridoxal-phosphate dependent enzyme [Desulfurococcales archaeon]